MVSSEELESYSSEEIEQESEAEQEQPLNNTENDAAIAAILDENEHLEEQAETSTNKRTSSGKQKVAPAKVTAFQTVVKTPNTADLMKSIRMLQKQVDTLQKDPKKRKIDVSSENAYDHDLQGSSGIPPKKLKLLKIKQLSSASNKLSPMNNSQQLSTAKSKQLSPAKKPTVSDSSEEEIELHPGKENDPLAQEVNEENMEVESTDDEGQDDDIFDDIVGSINIGGDDELLTGEPVPTSWADKLNTAWKTKIPKASYYNPTKVQNTQ